METQQQAIIIALSKWNEEMGKVDAGFGCSFSFSSGGIKTVLLAGAEKQKQYYADRIINGGISCTCVTEADAGSDAAAIRTTAVRHEPDTALDPWKLSGKETIVF